MAIGNKTACELELEQLRLDNEDLRDLLAQLQEAIIQREDAKLAVPLAQSRLRKARADLKTADQRVADLMLRARHVRARKSS
jgi:hypothetical protein